MSTQTKPWKYSLQPSPHLDGTNIPTTAFPLQTETIQSLGLQSAQFEVGCLQDLEEPDGLSPLILGYARWIMSVSDQSRIAFWIMAEDAESTVKYAIVIAQRTAEHEALTWEVYEATLEGTDNVEFGMRLVEAAEVEVDLPTSIRVLLCIDLQSSNGNLTYRGELEQGINISSFDLLKYYMQQPEGKYSSATFWRKELAEFVGCSERSFPTISCDRLIASTGNTPVLTQTLTMGVSWDQLETLAQEFHLKSPVSVVRAAFACILAEYLESDRVILGDRPSANPKDSGSVALVPVLLSDDDTANNLFCRVDGFTARAATFPNLPLEELREILRVPSGGTPYNALFTHHFDTLSCENLETTSHETLMPCLGAPMHLNFQRSEQGVLICTLSVRGDLMDAPHLELVLQQINALTAVISSEHAQSIRDLTQSFPNNLLSVHSPSASDQLQQAPLLSPAHWVDHWASINPAWSALEIIEKISEDETVSQTWTYDELSQTSNQLCAWLKAHGWRNQSIAVCLSRSFMAYALVLAIWKSGNCYVPVAEDLPEARQIFLLADSGAMAFFTDKSVAKTIVPPDNCLVIDIEDPELLEDTWVIEPATEFDPKPTDDCYLLYTSGSTGTPKGVLVSRGNLSAFTEAQSEYICRDVPDTLKLKGTGSYLAHASRAFDVHICEMVLGWRHGLRLVTGPRTMLLDNLYLVLSRLRISHAGFVPSLLEHAGISAEQVPDLRYLGVGGEKISETIIERFVGKPSIALVNAYGPTEVTIGMTSHTVTPRSTVRNIGTAVGNITIHVLEPDSTRYVKRGQAGELCVTGDLVANGYHRRPDAGGFTDLNGQQMYRTGDIVRLMANNCVEYLGRRDSQAKIRGQRLELEEVSVAVRRCADFPVNVTSIVTPSPITKRPQLVSFISPSSNRPEDTGTQTTFLKDKYQTWVPKILARCRIELPAYMVPSILLTVSSIPIQISGKADNRRLVALYESIPMSDLLLESGEIAIQLPQTAMEPDTTPLTIEEEEVRDILCSQLQIEQSSITRATNIFQLGIDSLASLGVAAKMRKAGYVCAASDVLSNPTIVRLACLPRTHKSGEGPRRDLFSDESDEASRKMKELDQVFRMSQKQFAGSCISVIRPCLPLQESLVSNSVGSPVPLYVNHIMCRLGPDITLPALKMAFEDLIQESEILRTCFHVADDRIVQVVLKPRAVSLPWTEVPVSDEGTARDLFNSVQTGIASNLVRQFETKPPLHLLAATSATKEGSGWLMLSIHHSIFDGASMDVFLGRLHRHYTGETAMTPVDLTPLYHYFATNDGKQAEQFWTQYLADCLPGIVTSHEGTDSSYEIVTKKLSFTLSKISKFASDNSTTASMVLETAWAITLAKHLNQRDIIYGRVMNGRGIPVGSVESMLIPLVTTIPGRFQLPSGESRVVDQIKTHTEAIIGSLPYQHTPLRDIQRYASASGPLFNSMFSYLASGPRSSADNMLLEMDSAMSVDYPLALEIKAESDPDTVTLRLRIASDHSSSDQGHALVDAISTLVEDLLSDGDVIVDAGTISQQQRKQEPKWDETQWSESEITIRGAVAEITGISELQVSKNVSFFALGIDSVISIHLARRLQESGLKVSSSDILRYPSIGTLHKSLDNTIAVSDVPLVDETTPDQGLSVDLFDAHDSIVETYHCTPLQTAMIGQCLSSEGKEYVHHHAVELPNAVDFEKMISAWQNVVEQVDILRTSFHRPHASREFHAAVHRSAVIQWSHEDVASLPVAVEQISQRAAYPNIKNFDRPPWKITFLTEASQKLMVVTMHHCLYDGFSLPMLFACVEKYYHGHQSHVGSFAPVARKIASTQESSVRFWTDSVAGYQYPQLQSPPAPTSTTSVQWAETKLESSVATLQHQCGSLNVTLQTVALLAFGRSLALRLGQRDVVFGHVVSGRGFDVDPTASVIGPLFNTVPFRLKLDSSQSIRSALRDIQMFCIDSQPHHHAPLSLIQKRWRLTTNGDNSSLFNAIFTFNKSQAPTQDSFFQPYEFSRKPDVPHHPLNVEFDQTEKSLVIRATSRDFLTNDELHTWLHNLARGIEDIVLSENKPVLNFPSGLSDLPLVATGPHQDEEKPVDTLVLGQNVQILRKILSDVTQISMETIQEGNSIFALGVDSILALDVSSRCREAGLMVSVSDILQGRTIRGIAMLVAGKPTQPRGSPKIVKPDNFVVKSDPKFNALDILGLSEDNIEAYMPCLSGQLFYISAWLQSKRQLWEFTFAFNSRIKLDPEQVQNAWLQLQRRHEILRTSFAAVSSNEVLQVVQKASKTSGEVQVYNEQSTGDLNTLVQDLVHRIARNPSDLFTPPARLHLIQHPDSDVLILTLHHALYDAWAITILVKELEALYQGEDLAPPCEFSSFITSTLQAANSESAQSYWEGVLEMGQRTILGPGSASHESNLHIRSSERIFSRKLREIQVQCRRLEVSAPSLMLLAVGRSLARTAGISHPTFGLFQSGRSSEYPRIQDMAGPTVNMLPLVVPDALTSPTPQALVAMQHDLVQRNLHDQTDLRTLCEKMKAFGNELQFNVIVNIVWGQLNGSAAEQDNDSIFTPFPLNSPIDSEFEEPPVGKTSVDHFDWKCLPGVGAIYLEVSSNERDDALLWKVEYTSDLISDDQAELFLNTLEKEMDNIGEA
ncbi:AMP-dependent synthetase/ligase [Penicillium expansum]|nr:AMP-dependent synthetase/ligase [Penicillium expansum]